MSESPAPPQDRVSVVALGLVIAAVLGASVVYGVFRLY